MRSPVALAVEDDGTAPPPSLLPPILHHPLIQAVLCAAGYLVHVVFLSRRHLTLGGYDVMLDTLTGLGVLGAVASFRQRSGARPIPAWLVGEVDPADGSDAGRECLDLRQAPKPEKLRIAATALVTLLVPFFFSKVSWFYDLLLYGLAALGLPFTKASLLGSRLLLEQTTVYALLFKFMSSRHGAAAGGAVGGGAPFFGKGSRWVRWDVRRPWLLPVLGGYAASLGIFNLVELLNQYLLPFLDYLPEGLVAKLANPSDGSLLSLFIASTTPSVGAPIFEEVHSRAFLLQAFTCVLPLRLAIAASGLLFGAQHLQLGLVLPLTAMGCFWGVMYAFSGNLLVPVLIHALWNSRVFIGSALAL